MMAPKKTMPTELYLFANAAFPTWPAIQHVLKELRRGDKTRLANFLQVKPSTVTELCTEVTQPAYQRVISILQFLQENGYEVKK